MVECGLCGMTVAGQDDMTVHAQWHGEMDPADVPVFVEVTSGAG